LNCLTIDLYRRAKAQAALRGRKFKELVEEGLRLVLDGPQGTRRTRSLARRMRRARGMIGSGMPDLASNPCHFGGLGRHARNR
jgi:hypothetical protein